MSGDKQQSAALRRELLKRRLARSGSVSAAQGIPRRAPGAETPAASSQASLYFLSQLDPGSAAYHMNAAYRLRGSLDLGLLQQAIDQVVQRHEILRSVFRIREGALNLVVLDSSRVKVQTIPPDEPKDGQWHDCLVARVRRPFDLHGGPLMRAEFLPLGPEDGYLLITLHHAIADEWSLGLLLEELALNYSGEGPGAPLSIQYGDYAAWQQERLGTVKERDLAFWRKRLEAPDQVASLAADHRRLAEGAPGALLHKVLSDDVMRRLHQLAREEGVTPFTVVMAAFQVLLFRFSGDRDVIFGTPAAHRDRPELESLIGLFLNSVVIRDTIDPSLTFREHLAQTRETAQGAYAHQDLPFEELVNALQPLREPGRNPIFQLMLVQETEPRAGRGFTGLSMKREQLDTGFAKLDMTVFARFDETSLHLGLEYRTDLFDGTAMDALLAAFGYLLESVATDADITLDELPLLNAIAVEQWVRKARGNHLPEPFELLPPQIDAQAGEATALRFAGGQVSYDQLRQQADNLACAASAQGVKPGDWIPVMADNGIDQVAGMLAAWRLGAGYVPLDPDYPTARTKAILDDLASTGKLAPIALAGSSSALSELESLVSLIDPASPPASGASWQARASRADDPAYIIYTSGSTGKPKGVPISQGNLAASTAARHAFYAKPPAVFLLLSSFAFDSSVAGLWWTLSSGGCLVMADAAERRDPRAIASLIKTCGVTHTLLLPQLWSLVMESPKHELDPLATVIVAGEACPVDLPGKHRERMPNCDLFNEYGPTEATVWATVHPFDQPALSDGPVPIGRPIPGMTAMVLGPRGQAQPAGAIGELCLAGPGLSAGYLGREDLTRAAFFDCKVIGGERAYRTGDLARQDPAGQLQFLGRVDEQIKLRGHRIEPGEIEALLITMPGVSDAHVGLNPAKPDQPVLTAWLATSRDINLEALRTFLRGSVPEIMLPTAVSCREALPRSANGKLAVAQLPRVESLPSRSGTPTLSATESALATLWAEVLGVPVQHPDDHFFDLGGHSLSGVSMMMSLEKAFDRSLPLSVLFEAPTLGSLAAVIDAEVHTTSSQSDCLVPVQPLGEQTPIFVVHSGARAMADYLGKDQPVFLLFKALDPAEWIGNTIEKMAERYLDAMRSKQAHGPYRLMGFSVGCQIAVEMAQRLSAEGETLEWLVLCEPPINDAALFYRQRARIARANLAAQEGFSARCGYFLGRLGQSLGLRGRRIHLRLKDWLARQQGRPSPADVLNWRQNRHYAALYWDYHQAAWSGPTVVFLPASEAVNYHESSAYWTRYFTGTLSLLLVPGTHSHVDLIEQEGSQAIARQLAQLLAGQWPEQGQLWAQDDSKDPLNPPPEVRGATGPAE